MAGGRVHEYTVKYTISHMIHTIDILHQGQNDNFRKLSSTISTAQNVIHIECILGAICYVNGKTVSKAANT